MAPLRTLFIAVCVCLTGALSLCPAPLWAAPASKAQIALLNKGAQAAKAGRFDEARQHYADAIALGSLNVAHLGLGRALQKAGGCRDALAEYDKARLAPQVGVPSPRQVEALLDKFTAELEEVCPGALIVACTPPEIELTLDGEPIACGESVERPPGRYDVRGVLPGGSAQRQVSLTALETTEIGLEITPVSTDPAQEEAIAAASLSGALLGGVLVSSARQTSALMGGAGVEVWVEPPATAQEIWGWSLMGAGAASLVTGGIFSALVLDNTDDVNALSERDTIDPDKARSLRDEGDLYDRLQWAGYGLGAALVGTGAILLLTHDETPEPSVGLRPWIGPDRVGLGLEFHH